MNDRENQAAQRAHIGDICHEFRSGPSTGRKKFQKGRARAGRTKTERLNALRLAKKAQAQTEEPPAKPTKRRPVRREK
jgi:hypothetical protein